MKEKIEQMVNDILPEFRSVQMRASNINLTAEFNGLKIDWESGKVTEIT